MASKTTELAETVIDFWIGDAADSPERAKERGKLWYKVDSRTDEVIRARFGELARSVVLGRLLEWGEFAEGALALIILLDQFSRNIHRGTREAFAQDRLARAIAVRAIDRGFDVQLSIPGRAFVYHPFEHSETLTDQDLSVTMFEKLVEDAPEEWKAFASGFVGYARNHRQVVAQFGRFPHRNAVLGRENTPEERAYLENASRYGQ